MLRRLVTAAAALVCLGPALSACDGDDPLPAAPSAPVSGSAPTASEPVGPSSAAPTSSSTAAAPTSSSDHASSQAASVPSLPPPGRWDYQIGGATEYGPAPAVVSRDSGDKPWPGVYSICYVNAFQSQPGDTSLRSSWLVVDGQPVEDPNWPGEYVLDTRRHASRLVAAFTTTMRSCAAKRFRAVEFDNLDSYERSKGGLTPADNVAYAKELVSVAHGLGLAAAQKNTSELTGQVPFDFAVTEQCLTYSDCGDYTAGYAIVLDVEYVEDLSEATFQSRCATAARAGAAPRFVFRDRNVSPAGVRAWCTAQT